MKREVELKLEAEAGAAARLRAHPLLAGSEARSEPQQAVYFDTPRHKLRREGYSLRVRREGGGFVQTVKAGAVTAGLFDRDEWEAPVAGLEPDAAAAAGTPLAPLLTRHALRRLAPVVRTEVVRTAWRVGHDGGAVEVTLDEGRIAGGAAEQPLHEVEIELVEGEPGAVVAVARALAERVPLRLGVLSKAERGFALADGSLARPAKAGPAAVTAGMSVAQGFTAVAHSCLRHFRLNEPLVVSGRHAGALHQARVAMRRLRSALSLFRPALIDPAFPELREELRWFTAQLGEARNLDVFLGRLDRNHGERARLEAAREEAYSAVVGALASQRFRDLMLAIVAWVETGAWRSGAKANRPLRGFAGRRIERLWAKVEPLGAHLAELDEEPRHRLRIEIKKLRYALEFLAPLYRSAGARQKKFMAALEGLQEELGQLNDLATARAIAAGLEAAGEEAEDDGAAAEADHLAKSEGHFRRLAKAGPFWRGERPTAPAKR